MKFKNKVVLVTGGGTGLGRVVVSEDIAEAAVYLAAEAHSTTGQTILVDGGFVALGPNA